MNAIPRIKVFGKKGILLEFEAEISDNLLQKLLGLKKLLEDNFIEERVEIINTYCSLLICYDRTIEDVYSQISAVEQIVKQFHSPPLLNNQTYRIPICYEEDFAPDISSICSSKRLSKSEFVRLHSNANYRVFFTGFLPGFMYLGGLPPTLHFPRRSEPRLEVPKGSVGIGENQTGIYPQNSPGGWTIIGNSPVSFFDPFSDPPCKIRAGDHIKFYPITLEEHRNISDLVRKGLFRLEKQSPNA